MKSWQMSHASNVGHNKRLIAENTTLNQTIDNYKKSIHTYKQEIIILKKEINNYKISDKHDKKIIFDLENDLKTQNENLSSGDKEDLYNKNIALKTKINGIEIANVALNSQIDISGKQLKNIIYGKDTEITNLKKKIQADDDITKKLKTKYIKLIEDQAENNKLKDQPKQIYFIISPTKSPIKRKISDLIKEKEEKEKVNQKYQ